MAYIAELAGRRYQTKFVCHIFTLCNEKTVRRRKTSTRILYLFVLMVPSNNKYEVNAIIAVACAWPMHSNLQEPNAAASDKIQARSKIGHVVIHQVTRPESSAFQMCHTRWKTEEKGFVLERRSPRQHRTNLCTRLTSQPQGLSVQTL